MVFICVFGLLLSSSLVKAAEEGGMEFEPIDSKRRISQWEMERS
jgi:hypothetical protein